MLIKDLLSNKEKDQLQSINKSMQRKKKRKKKAKQERLSQREWKDIMGVNRDTYTRRNGAVRRK